MDATNFDMSRSWINQNNVKTCENKGLIPHRIPAVKNGNKSQDGGLLSMN